MGAVNKVAFNTLVLYIQMVITIAVSLYSTRIVLNALGAPDFGLFNVIAGVIGMLAFLNAAMTTSTQRYLSFNHGTNDLSKVESIFANSMIIHFVIGIVLVVVLETGGIYFLQTKLSISADRLWVAKLLFHCAVISTFFSVIAVPYDAVLNAHENMVFVAITNIIESMMKLGLAFYLLVTGLDKLLAYGVSIMLITIIMRVIKGTYSKRRYRECNAKLLSNYDPKVRNELMSFAGWNLFGVLCSIFRSQGVAIVLNMFFGTVVNAAYAIGNQVNGQLSFFSQTMMKTIRPQMMKSEGSGDRGRMLKLANISGKFSFYLFSIFCIPLFIEMPWVLKFWLNNVPNNTVLFCRLILILTLIQQLSVGIMAATQAIGQIKLYQTVAGTIQLFTLPIGYVFFRFGYPSYSILVVAIGLEVLASIFRIFYYEYLTTYRSSMFFRNIILIPFIPFTITSVFFFYLSQILPESFLSVFIVFGGSVTLYPSLIYFLGIDAQEKIFINSIFITVKSKIFK